jgi:Asparagine synthase (glutamine-hydrolyzing)
LHTWSIDYVDNDRYFRPTAFQPNPDAPWVTRVSNALGTVHHTVFIDTPDLVAALRDAVVARDLPGMADVDASLLLFSRAIKEKATVGLSGECADEVFGGYPWFYREETQRAKTFPWMRNLPARIRLFSRELVDLVQPETYLDRRYQEALDEVPRLPGEPPQDAKVRELFYLNLTRWMPTLLDRKDRMSMAAGLELRVPFCDHRIVEYLWNVPWAMKFYQQREKGLLRHALAGVLPANVLWRKKSPYPKTYHPLYWETVKRLVLSILEDPTSPLRPFVNATAIREWAEQDPSAPEVPLFGQLMGRPQFFAYLVQVDHWMRTYNVRVV